MISLWFSSETLTEVKEYYGILKQASTDSGRLQDLLHQARPVIDKAAYMDSRKKCHKIACTSLSEDEHLYVRSMSKTL